ncbi:phage major capsid protein [Xanthomonas translucens pv. translucens]|uniref:phage major capsid protein n=1 Tax=Xanthomonas campestris pv. translucens TaxID=343 RepID=UPI003F6E7F69
MTMKAYSLLTVKSVDEEKRIIRGIASTPTVDRVGDIVVSTGARFKTPMPLMLYHNDRLPVGQVVFAKATADGIPFEATLPDVIEPGTVKDRVDEAWHSVKYKLLAAVSIGFSPIEGAVELLKTGGLKFLEWDWLELSLVAIPANPDAVIQSFKSMDSASIRRAFAQSPDGDEERAALIKSIETKQRAAIGRSAVPVVRLPASPGASGNSISNSNPKPEEGTMNILEQIKQYEATRATKSARMVEIMKASAEAGATLDAAQEEEYDTLASEVKAVDAHLKRLQDLQAANVAAAAAVPAAAGTDPAAAAAARSGAPAVVRSVKNDEPGVGFAKFAMAMFAGKGDVASAKAFAEHTFGNDTRLQSVMKAAVAAGTTTSPTWAGNLVEYQNLSGEFVEFLRPRTITGQMGVGNVPALRRVPFNVRIPGKTSAGRAQWTGEGYRKPVTASGYEAAELKWAKIAAISVVTEELERFADPSIQLLVRDDLAEAVIERADEDFVDPDKAVGTGANASPASITNGVTPIPATGDPSVDIPALWAVADASNLPVGSAVYITDTATVRALSGRKTPLGAREYPNVTMMGGDIDGVPVIVSNYVPTGLFILAFASEIYLSDDGVVNIDVSREATIVMDDDATATPTMAQLVSMFQTNQLAIRAERYINWKKRRPQAVAFLSGVAWGTAAEPGS